MAEMRTDDDIYRARLLYLGPTGYTLPIQLPYAQYGLFAIVCAVFVTGGFLLTGSFALIGVALGLSFLVTSVIWRHVDPDRPARKIFATVATDWRRTRPNTDALPRLSANRVRIGELP